MSTCMSLTKCKQSRDLCYDNFEVASRNCITASVHIRDLLANKKGNEAVIHVPNLNSKTGGQIVK